MRMHRAGVQLAHSEPSEPETIFWFDAVARFAAAGYEPPDNELLNAIINNSVGYYPRTALNLERFYRMGLFDPKTGVLRTHVRDPGRSIRPILADVVRYCSRKKDRSGDEVKTPPITNTMSVSKSTLTAVKTKATKDPKTKRSSRKRDRALEAIRALWPEGIPSQRSVSNKLLCTSVSNWLKEDSKQKNLSQEPISDSTIKRAAGRPH
jgi:hypothetical protein